MFKLSQPKHIVDRLANYQDSPQYMTTQTSYLKKL